jgi:hypothetical protein
MAETFTGTVKLSVVGTLLKDIDIGSVSHLVNYTASNTFANGTGVDAANMVWVDTRTLSASASEDLDVAGGLTNALGTTLTFTKIKGIIIAASAANTNNVVVGGDTNALVNWVGAANDVINVRPGGIFCLTAPDATAYAVTASTGDVLQIANSSSGTSVTYDIIIIGVV